MEHNTIDPTDQATDEPDYIDALGLPSGMLMDDRTGSEIDDQCGMRFWWTRHQDGTGIVPIEEPAYFEQGRRIHEDMAILATIADPAKWVYDEIKLRTATLPPEQKDREILYRHLGWLAAWALYHEPRIRERYETVQIEHELILSCPVNRGKSIDPGILWVPIIPDRVVRRKANRHLEYWEYKTALAAGQKWQSSWQYQPQLHLGQEAIEQELHEKVSFAQIIGLMKGYPYTDADHQERLIHPYVWAYSNGEHWSVDRVALSNWKRRPVWEYPDGLLAWVQFCGEDVALSQFPRSVPVFKSNRMIQQWVERRYYRQEEIQTYLDEGADPDDRHLYFEPRTKQCEPPYGDKCPYVKCCWNAQIGDDPIGSGLFVKRDPHHEVERIILQQKGLL